MNRNLSQNKKEEKQKPIFPRKNAYDGITLTLVVCQLLASSLMLHSWKLLKFWTILKPFSFQIYHETSKSAKPGLLVLVIASHHPWTHHPAKHCQLLTSSLMLHCWRLLKFWTILKPFSFQIYHETSKSAKPGLLVLLIASHHPWTHHPANHKEAFTQQASTDSGLVYGVPSFCVCRFHLRLCLLPVKDVCISLCRGQE